MVACCPAEELATLLPDANFDDAALVAQRLRAAIVKVPIVTLGGRVEVTISPGVAHFNASAGLGTVANLIAIANYRMVKAVRDGRNRVVGESA
jgi:PleD family two-component response regulator